ncbi:MAG: 4Fe-4S binding protein [Clostridia bacterium]|nr:4Fe-4S binding protein [Clostridia bacterium]
MKLTSEQILSVKGRGFLRNRGTDLFSGRVVARGSVFTAEQFRDLSILASTYGNGKLICTSRLSVEVPGIPFDQIEAAEAFAAAHDLHFGGTGAKVRPVAVCKGSTCVFGNFDTHALAQKIHDAYYLGWSEVKLPHKFKIGVGGCPNSCMKPSLNDFGVEGHKAPRLDPTLCRGCKECQVEKRCPVGAATLTDGKLVIREDACISCGVCTGKCPFGAVAAESETLYRIYIGGTWGKTTRMGSPLSRLVREEEILPILEKSLLWFKENGLPKERFGKAIDRVGLSVVEAALFDDGLLARREEILSK